MLVGVAIGLQVYAVRVKDDKPSRSQPETSFSRKGKTAVPAGQSQRIQQLIRHSRLNNLNRLNAQRPIPPTNGWCPSPANTPSRADSRNRGRGPG